jgi:hypothetical protein
MRYPNCYGYWVEVELPKGSWTSLDFKAGWSTIEEAQTRIQEQRAMGEPWKSRTYRIVDRYGEPIKIPTAA